ncbi:MAG: radical SAM protein [Sporichthyaceae bacterium]
MATRSRLGPSAFEIDGGSMDCGSGLLLLVTRGMRAVPAGEVLVVRTEEKSVVDDLPSWARLAGHELLGVEEESRSGPWHLSVRRGLQAGFSTGGGADLGTRLWLYTNFDCNLACDYCCAESSPKAPARRMPADLAFEAVEQFAALGGRELLLTGGEPFLHPDLGRIVERSAARMPVTVLTNAMVFGRGTRRATLEAMDRDRVTLQISLDSGTAEGHDRHRGKGSFGRAVEGIRLARDLGFRVRISVTLYAEDLATLASVHRMLDAEGIPPDDRLVRPVAHEGAAESGVHITVDSIAPEPTLTADGAWWHPVGVADQNLRVTDSPLPVDEVFATVRDAVRVQDASAHEGRAVFRCV